MYFQALERVEFRDTDAAGIAHFSVFFNWMERAEHAFLRRLGFSVVQATAEGKISWPRVAANCDFFRPIGFEQLFGVQVHVVRMGRSSCTYRFQFLSLDTWSSTVPLAVLPASAVDELAEEAAGQGDFPVKPNLTVRSAATQQPFLDGIKNPNWLSSRDWFDTPDIQPFASGTITAVCCRVEPGQHPKSIAIPELLRQRLAEFMHPGEAQ